MNEEKMQVKQIKGWTVIGEIQTSTMIFIACLTRFCLISHPLEIPIEFPQAHADSSQYPYPSHIHTHGNPHTHGRPGVLWSRDRYNVLNDLQLLTTNI